MLLTENFSDTSMWRAICGSSLGSHSISRFEKYNPRIPNSATTVKTALTPITHQRWRTTHSDQCPIMAAPPFARSSEFMNSVEQRRGNLTQAFGALLEHVPQGERSMDHPQVHDGRSLGIEIGPENLLLLAAAIILLQAILEVPGDGLELVKKFLVLRDTGRR